MLNLHRFPEAVVRRCSVKKVFLKISQNSLEKHVCQSLFFNKVAGLRPTTDPGTGVFLNTCGQLLLNVLSLKYIILSPYSLNFIKKRGSGRGVFL